MKKTILFLLAALLFSMVWGIYNAASSIKPRERRGEPAAKPVKPEQLAAPVTAAQVETQDVPVYLDAVGTVQGFNTVTVRARVDGQLEKVLFREGEDVQKDDVLAILDARPFQAAVTQAKAKRLQNEALLRNARLDLQRDLALLEEKAGTAQKADTQRALVAQLEAALQADDAAIDAANVQLEYTKLRSPIDGRTGIRLIDEGNVVRANDTSGVVVVTQLRPISVVFTLSEKHLPRVQEHLSGEELDVAAVGRDNSTLLAEGVLSVVDNQIDPTTGTFRLKATFSNGTLALWPGQFVNVRLKLKTISGASVVPASALQRGPAGTFVYVITPGETAEVRLIKVGPTEGGLVVVEEGLSSGERVVLDGHFRVQPGGRIRVVSSSALKESGQRKPKS